LGGKRLLAKRIIEKIDRIDHCCYAEPFFGMGGVFFRRPQPVEVEIINDISKDVTCFLRVLQRHFVEFVGYMRWHVTTRSEFERLKRLETASMTDLEVAARFFYLQKLSFGGKERGRFDITRIEANLEELHERLAGVQIESLDYADFIRRYDRPGTLFYLDPPYYGNENDYGKGLFSRSDFEKLAEILASIKGRFLMSLNDLPDVRRIFKKFSVESVETIYSCGGGSKTRPASEVIISG
jgi:DNA adenine methylase